MAKDRMDALTKAAARVAAGLPGVDEGIACAGTAIESRTYKVKGKAFVFVRPGNVMLKLGPSLAEAATMAKTANPPGSLKAGAGGWVTISKGGAGLAVSVMTRWVKESHGLFTAGSDKAKHAGKKAVKKVAKKVGKKAVKKTAKKAVKKTAKKAGGASRRRASAKKSTAKKRT